MSQTNVAELCRQVGEEVSPCFFENLLKLFAKFLPKATPAELADIIDLRLDAVDETYSEMLGEQQTPAKMQLRAKYSDFKFKHAKARVDDTKGKASSVAKQKKLVADGTRLYPKFVHAVKLGEADALLYLPVGSSATKCLYENRWKLKWSTYNRSRTWTMHGELSAFALCAGYLWEMHAKAGGDACPFEWVTKIYKADF
jgi:hypothetical protein